MNKRLSFSIQTWATGRLRIAPSIRYCVETTQFRDPAGQPDLRKGDGRDEKCQEWIASDPRIAALLDAMPLYISAAANANDADFFFSIGLHDKKGRFISPAVAELLKRRLIALFPDCQVVVIHHDILEGQKSAVVSYHPDLRPTQTDLASLGAH